MDSLRKGYSVASVLSHKNGQRKFADYEAQIRNLKNKFGVEAETPNGRDALRNVTYYRLKGYILALLHESGNGAGVSLEKAEAIHHFDANLHAVMLYALEKIEIRLRSQFSYFHAEKYGPFGYLDANHYDAKHDHPDFLSRIEKAVEDNLETPFVEHYLKNHDGLMPFWTASELMTFGQWPYFYADLTPLDRLEFLKRFYRISDSEVKKEAGTAPGDKIRQWRSAKSKGKKNNKKRTNSVKFLSWIRCCAQLRNVCAHGGRLYARNFTRLPDMPENFETFKNVSRLWSAVLSVQFLYPDADDWKNNVLPQMRRLFAEYRSRWGETEFRRLLAGFGFPENWEAELQKW